MDIETWMHTYRVIVRRLSLDEAADEEASHLLLRLLEGRMLLTLGDLSRRVAGAPVAVYGAGPSLQRDLERVISLGLYDRLVNAAADGAVSAFIRAGRIPDLIFTDLDGAVGDQLAASRRGSWIIVHAHGDNMGLLKENVRRISGPLLGSCQVLPIPPTVLNLGGFTDGDRGVHWAAELGASPILLLGMDFGDRVGAYSKPGLAGEALHRKLEKLRIGCELIGRLASSGREILNLTGSKKPIPNVPCISPEDALALVGSV